jgi:hypothetical protein
MLWIHWCSTIQALLVLLFCDGWNDAEADANNDADLMLTQPSH